MASCIVFQVTTPSGPTSAISVPGGYTVLPWSVGDATFSAGAYSCPVGSHLVMTITEVNARAASVPDPQLMRENFFMSFGLVIGCWFIGKMVGSVLHLLRGRDNDY